MPFANRTHHLQPEGAYEVLARANQLEAAGKDIIHLEIGQPDYPTFENVSQAGIEAIRTGKTRYTPPAGIPALREAIAEQAINSVGLKSILTKLLSARAANPICSSPPWR